MFRWCPDLPWRSGWPGLSYNMYVKCVMLVVTCSMALQVFALNCLICCLCAYGITLSHLRCFWVYLCLRDALHCTLQPPTRVLTGYFSIIRGPLNCLGPGHFSLFWLSTLSSPSLSVIVKRLILWASLNCQFALKGGVSCGAAFHSLVCIHYHFPHLLPVYFLHRLVVTCTHLITQPTLPSLYWTSWY